MGTIAMDAHRFTKNNEVELNQIQYARCMAAVPDFDLSVSPTLGERNSLHNSLSEVYMRQYAHKTNGIATDYNSNIFEYLYGDDCDLEWIQINPTRSQFQREYQAHSRD